MKKIKFIIFMTLISVIPFFEVDAASANITVTASKTRVIVGETVTVTVKISSSETLGTWEFDVVPSSNLTLTSSSFGGLHVVDVANVKSKTYTFTFKAKSSDTGSVTIKNS